MADPLSLQQILSMGTHVEKIQQVQQQQHDVNAKNFAQDMQAINDEKKIEVPAQGEGSEIKSANDETRQKANQERKNKRQRNNSTQETEEIQPVEEMGHGNRINIVV